MCRHCHESIKEPSHRLVKLCRLSKDATEVVIERKRDKGNDDDYLSSCGGRMDQVCDCDWAPALDGAPVFSVLAGRAQAGAVQ